MTTPRPIRAASAAGAQRRRTTSLSPAHLGEATAAATVAVVVGGIALVVTGIGVVVMTLTLGTRYAGDPPPDLASLMIAPTIGGVAFLLLGGALAAGGLAVLGDVPRARLVTGVLAALTTALAAAGTVLVMINPPPAPVIAIALTIAALVFGIAAILLLRRRR
ncbi:MAG TPA: hypothetical protein VIH24_09465 [Candidatus Limnocylindria bacterium]|jgi:hypothetical protein